jgi:hypothetical protein
MSAIKAFYREESKRSTAHMERAVCLSPSILIVLREQHGDLFRDATQIVPLQNQGRSNFTFSVQFNRQPLSPYPLIPLSWNPYPLSWNTPLLTTPYPLSWNTPLLTTPLSWNTPLLTTPINYYVIQSALSHRKKLVDYIVSKAS